MPIDKRSNKNPKDLIIYVTQLNNIYHNILYIKKTTPVKQRWAVWEVV